MKTLEEYLALPYTMMVRWSADDELYVARVKEIERCTGHGNSEAEALAMLRDNLREWISFCLETGDQVPIPTELEHLPSGKWLQRVPRSLHKRLIACADEDGVSLNAYVTACLSRAVGMAEASSIQRSLGTIIGLDASAAVSQHAESFPLYQRVDIPTSGPHVYACDFGSRHEFRNYGSGLFNSIMIKANDSQYSAFVDLVADQLPDHCTSTSERIAREEEKHYKKSAYA
jgi:predicted RNase H-like HicB family nuclease